MAERKATELMERIVSLCKRRGLIYPSSEIYGGINGFWDYGPLGAELKRNVKELWWRSLVHHRDDVTGLEATIIMHPTVWKASGHVDTFTDPMSTCRHCKKLVRTDQVWELLAEQPWGQAIAKLCPGGQYQRQPLWQWARGKGIRLAPGLALICNLDAVLARLDAKAAQPGTLPQTPEQLFCELATLDPATTGQVTPCPHCGGELTPPRRFNLMFKTNVGPVESDDNVAYLRPETAQAIFVQFKNVLETSRQRVPFGIAQIGKAFRNEVTPRNFTFRSREFEQMELEFFIRPDEVVAQLAGAVARLADLNGAANLTQPQPNWGWEVWHKYWVEERIRWYESIGLPRTSLEEYWQKPEELAHYAKATVDILYKFPFGTQELEGIAARGDFDLTQHQKTSGKSMEYFDEEAKAKYVPHVIEPSAGVDRLILALICNAYTEDLAPDDKGKLEPRIVMRFHPRVAPIKVGVFPLLKNRPELVRKALAVRDLLRPHLTVFYDDAGAIGRRYRRQDEAGTPFGVTIDFDTLGEQGPELQDTVTLRDRDTMKQERVKIDELLPRLLPLIR
ncbi:MAG: glycine--tRNA ligase [Verrucomicrobia bacterium]|nr:glycine--tRNA ligase [Verrucomicrobiota bacterium]